MGSSSAAVVRATVRIDDLFATLLSLSYHRNNATAAAPPQQRGKGSGKDAEDDDDDKDDAAAWGAWLARMRAAAPNSRPLFNALSSDQLPPATRNYRHRAGPAPLAGASQQASEESSRPAASTTAGGDHRRDRPQGPAASGPQVQGSSVRWHELGSHSAAVQRGRFKLVASLAVVGDHTPARFME
jgi:hypothetical protein